MKDAEKWGYSLDGETFHLSGTKEDAYQEGNERAYEMEKPKFYIGKAVDYKPHIYVEGILERLRENAYDEVGECSEGYLEPTGEQANELEDEINHVFDAWAKRYGQEPHFYRVAEEETYETVEPVEDEDNE